MGLTLERRIATESPLQADTIEKLLANPESQFAKDIQAACINSALLSHFEKEQSIRLTMEAFKKRELEKEELIALQRYLQAKAEKNLQKLPSHDTAMLNQLLATCAGYSQRLGLVVKSALVQLAYHLGNMHQASLNLQAIAQQQQQLVQQRQTIQQQFANNVINGLANQTLTLNDGRTIVMQLPPADEIDALRAAQGPAPLEQLFARIPAMGIQFNQLVENELDPHGTTKNEAVPPPPALIIEAHQNAAKKMNLHHKPVVNKHIEARGFVERWLQHNLTSEDIKKIVWSDSHKNCGHIQNVNKFAEKICHPELLKAEISKMIDKGIECGVNKKAQRDEYNKERNAASSNWDMLLMLLKDPKAREQLNNFCGSALSAYPDVEEKIANICRK